MIAIEELKKHNLYLSEDIMADIKALGNLVTAGKITEEKSKMYIIAIDYIYSNPSFKSQLESTLSLKP